MQNLISKLQKNSVLFSSAQKCAEEVKPILDRYITNFKDYTDHTLKHSQDVLQYAEYLLSDNLEKLNEDEIYILIMAGYLHDIGMCPTEEKIAEIKNSEEFIQSGKVFENYLRDIHHILSHDFIIENWQYLHIINEKYAHGIALVGMGHRVVDLSNFIIYKPQFTVRNGLDSVCLPYLAGILRLADELDITNDRTPDLLFTRFLPKNAISKAEWEKHRANYSVNFFEPEIRISSQCINKDLYYALLKHYNKIDEILKYVQKLIYQIPQNRRNLSLIYHKLDRDITTSGFVPKEIGFSFDFQNTIDTFIGSNIYTNRFVALRECLQNAIDSCFFKKDKSDNEYEPQITIELLDDKLIICDNGFGMNEFIVENYFAKLSKSYYAERSNARNFEAISQFGIGVFSYFLLCDYFEVDTKYTDQPSLSFRVDKQANNYFYFYDNPTRTSSGTTISMSLKNEVNFDELCIEIRRHIRHVPINILVKWKDRSEIIAPMGFDIDPIEMLNDMIDRHHLPNLADIYCLSASFANDEIEGQLGIIVNLDDAGHFIPVNTWNQFRVTSLTNLEISQKGIYVGNEGITPMEHLIGKVNFKKKNQLGLSRTKFKDSVDVISKLKPFYSLIFEKLFENWKTAEPQKQVSLYSLFVNEYIDTYDSVFPLELLIPFYNEIKFRFFDGIKLSIISFTDVLKLQTFAIGKNNEPFDERHSIIPRLNLESIFKELECPIIIEQNYGASRTLLNKIIYENCKLSLVQGSKNWFIIAHPNEKLSVQIEMVSHRKVLLIDFNGNQICALPRVGNIICFNTKHSIIRYIYNNQTKFKETQKLHDASTTFINILSSTIYELHNSASKVNSFKEELNLLNKQLMIINTFESTSFEIGINDFPMWTHKLFKT